MYTYTYTFADWAACSFSLYALKFVLKDWLMLTLRAVLPVTQGWFRTCSAVKRLDGSTCRSDRITLLAVGGEQEMCDVRVSCLDLHVR